MKRFIKKHTQASYGKKMNILALKSLIECLNTAKI